MSQDRLNEVLVLLVFLFGLVAIDLHTPVTAETAPVTIPAGVEINRPVGGGSLGAIALPGGQSLAKTLAKATGSGNGLEDNAPGDGLVQAPNADLSLSVEVPEVVNADVTGSVGQEVNAGVHAEVPAVDQSLSVSLKLKLPKISLPNLLR